MNTRRLSVFELQQLVALARAGRLQLVSRALMAGVAILNFVLLILAAVRK